MANKQVKTLTKTMQLKNKKLIYFLKCWFAGTICSTIGFLLYWFTGGRKFYSTNPETLSELLLALKIAPHIILGSAVITSLLIGFVFYITTIRYYNK
jgi:hypothetical protein